MDARVAARYGGLAVLATGITLAVLALLLTHASVDDVWRRREAIAAWVAGRPLLGLAGFTLLSAAVTAACLPASGLLVVVGGALFGTIEGGAAALLGSVAGSTLVFLACRAASPRWKGVRPAKGLGRLMGMMSQHAFSTLVVLRLTPVAPLSVVNFAAGLAQMRLGPFLVASILGSAPSNFIYAALGAGLKNSLKPGGGSGARLDPAMLSNPRLIWPLFALAALAAAAALANRARRP